MCSLLFQFQQQLILNQKEVNFENIKSCIEGKVEEMVCIIKTIEQHNDKIYSLIGNGYTKATYIKYQSTLKQVKEFVLFKYQETKLDINKVSTEFISEFEHYLRANKTCAINTTTKYLKNLSKILNESLMHGKIKASPFEQFKLKHEKTERQFLTQQELKA